MSPAFKNILMTIYGLFILPFWLASLYLTFILPYLILMAINMITRGNSIWVDRKLKSCIRSGCKSLNFMKGLLCAAVPCMEEFIAESMYDVTSYVRGFAPRRRRANINHACPDLFGAGGD
uniref:Protein E22 n=5 Tax=Elephantid herpesvirus 1 TaxID=146015 RepID=A0A1L3HP32_ELHV1|nr:protein E22 [Elephant endotheliotropic herpesvirus 1A]AYC62687.1 protein E22 [Elephant endotheliotropic herpesvirus 1B]AYC62707.1 protein E22 [Elephant endotheliotropic herpesvirus 1A]AYC62721.1 protein E22 [Elephant endotheliotropic herpesvirus 1A]AYC62749.1 protein E22 [Elephant endotheliotropic herpesvirus 1A]